MSDNGITIKLRTVDDSYAANEWVFNQRLAGKIDDKTTDSLNTTLKGTNALHKLRLDAAKLMLQAHVRKFDLPDKLLSNITT